jgi:hypothetical protein
VVYTNPCCVVLVGFGMVKVKVSGVVVDVFLSGVVVNGDWWSKILPYASWFLSMARLSAVRT